MNSRQKEVLASGRSLLTRNIIWTPQLATLLKEQGVATDSILADIEAAPERQDKVRLLLDILPLRGAQAYEKFCDILHLTGHLFLSDFLREEESRKEGLDTSDLSKRLPVVSRGLKDIEKKQLEAYILEKIQSETMKYVWKRDTKEKEKWLETKQLQLNEAQEFEQARKSAFDKIKHLEQCVQEAQDAHVKARTEKRVLERQLHEMQEKHRDSMNIQIKYNTANDSAIQRSGEQVGQLKATMKTIHNTINDLVTLKPRESERDLMALSENEFAFLVQDFEVFVSKYKELLEVQQAYETLLEERNLMLLHLGYAPEDQGAPSLLLAFKDFAVTNDENIHKLRREISRYGDLLQRETAKVEDLTKEKDSRSQEDIEQELKKSKMASGAAVWQAAIMTVMRKQLNDLKIDVRKKGTQLTMQEEEMTKMKAKLTAQEKLIERCKERATDTEDMSETRQTLNSHLSASLESLEGRKSKMLPPIRLSQYQPPSHSPVPKHGGSVRKHPSSVSRTFHREPISLSDGLIAGPVRLENRSKNQMGNVVGDLKSLHNRHRTSAFNGRNSMTIVGKEVVSPTPRRHQAKVRT
ncbi:uncharacterized protein [Haliotis cracherodii]|uniref:uncharacterized protein n=1 Tax=Haliotis cracherodii TaxID=6455 RepID=UPI0039E93B92